MSMPSFLLRRQQLLAQMQARGGGIAIIPTAYEMVRNSDNFFPFRHDSYFYYLSGFTEPEALIVLIANGHEQRSILFCREKIWNAKSGMAIDSAPLLPKRILVLTQALR